jgi:alkanesulfonate monooxygenase SsuD/methylene tetrahydromethanopterin reductase-like flavin-dependent oxidoreductase (luciferase family)
VPNETASTETASTETGPHESVSEETLVHGGGRMKFSSFHLYHRFEGWSDKEVYDYHAELAEWLEELGFDGIWVAEHHFRDYGAVPNVMGMLSNFAARTDRLRLGTGITVLPLHNPIDLAEQGAQLDVISGGRLDFGAGRGYQSVEFDGFGIPLTEARDRFNEALDMIIGLWSNPRFSFEGRFYRTGSEVELVPKPLQRPHPPVKVAAVSPETVTMYAERGVQILADPATPFNRIREAAQTWYRVAAEHGHDTSAAELAVMRVVHVAPSLEQARDDLDRFDRIFDRSRHFNAQSAPIDTSTGTIAKGFEYWDRYDRNIKVDNEWRWERQEVIGDPDRVIEQIRMLQGSGFSEIMCDFGSTRPVPVDEMKKTLKLFADEVIPAFR